MKNVCMALVFIMTLQATAQKKRGADLSPEQMATLSTKKMTLDLDLDKNQQEKIYALQVENASKIKARRKEAIAARTQQEGKKPSSEERYAMQVARLDFHIAQKNKMKAILTPTQFETWEQMKKQHQRKQKTKSFKKKAHPRKEMREGKK